MITLPHLPRRALVAAAVAAALSTSSACAVRRYPVKVHFTAEAADRRLARGQADVVVGRIARAEPGAVYLDGDSTPLPASDIAEIEQHKAQRDVRWGAAFAVGGTVVAVVSAFYFDCGPNDVVVFCAFQSEGNFQAGLAFLGGVVVAGAGLGAVFAGKGDQARNARLLEQAGVRVSSWWIAPTPVATADGVAPGVGLGLRY